MAESSRRALVEVLGAERRDRILSALYLARQDAVNVVRQSSAHIWKALVHNTPRTGIFLQLYFIQIETDPQQLGKFFRSLSAKSSCFFLVLRSINKK